MKENKFYRSAYDVACTKSGDYKEELAEQKKEATRRTEALLSQIKRKREKIKALEADINEMLEARNLYDKELKHVKEQYKYRRRILALLRKHDYLKVSWPGEEYFLTWVWSTDFNGYNDGDDYSLDPFYDEHYKDTYEEAYNACLTYIKMHEKK
tara:strand:+ start:102 stop:563 length:462 start_codon:yes stop_codon:yes gene_type:complete